VTDQGDIGAVLSAMGGDLTAYQWGLRLDVPTSVVRQEAARVGAKLRASRSRWDRRAAVIRQWAEEARDLDCLDLAAVLTDAADNLRAPEAK
jgi:hypothetical protein